LGFGGGRGRDAFLKFINHQKRKGGGEGGRGRDFQPKRKEKLAKPSIKRVEGGGVRHEPIWDGRGRGGTRRGKRMWRGWRGKNTSRRIQKRVSGLRRLRKEKGKNKKKLTKKKKLGVSKKTETRVRATLKRKNKRMACGGMKKEKTKEIKSCKKKKQSSAEKNQ